MSNAGARAAVSFVHPTRSAAASLVGPGTPIASHQHVDLILLRVSCGYRSRSPVRSNAPTTGSAEAPTLDDSTREVVDSANRWSVTALAAHGPADALRTLRVPASTSG